jgi:hypothetical protein
MKMPLSICLIRFKKASIKQMHQHRYVKKHRLINFLAAEQALQTLFEPAGIIKISTTANGEFVCKLRGEKISGRFSCRLDFFVTFLIKQKSRYSY